MSQTDFSVISLASIAGFDAEADVLVCGFRILPTESRCDLSPRRLPGNSVLQRQPAEHHAARACHAL